MTEIPGWAYLGVGAFVTGFSKFVEIKAGKNMGLFIFLGSVFLIIGAAKIAYARFVAKKAPKKDPRQMQQPLRVNPQQRQGQPLQNNFPQMWEPKRGPNNAQGPRVQNQQSQQQTAHHNVSRTNFNTGSHHVHQVRDESPADHSAMNSTIACPNCNIKHYSYAKFCMMCGYKIR